MTVAVETEIEKAVGLRRVLIVVVPFTTVECILVGVIVVVRAEVAAEVWNRRVATAMVARRASILRDEVSRDLVLGATCRCLQLKKRRGSSGGHTMALCLAFGRR